MAMYYQVLIETTEKIDGSAANKQYFELDRSSLTDIETHIVLPYLRKEAFLFSGIMIKFKDIKHILIKETQKTTYDLSLYESARSPHSTVSLTANDILNYKEHVKDITTTVFNKALSALMGQRNTLTLEETPAPAAKHAKILIVHDKDHVLRNGVVTFLEKLGISAIIFHEQILGNPTIIEKFEEHTNIGFAIVLYAPIDPEQKSAAPQSTVFEHGYLIGKLDQRKVAALVKGHVVIQNRIKGVTYTPMDQFNTWQLALTHELIRAGYHLSINQVMILKAGI
jgi:predicted nucleotide-binding protein